MFFILVMDVLSSLINKAENSTLLHPLSARSMGHRLSLYADDAVMFVTPGTRDVAVVKAMLSKFGAASGLHTNLAKSSILPIRCEQHDVLEMQQRMECAVKEFPCKYLGIPLSIRRLTNADLQPYIDKVADMLPTWRAALMATSGRLILLRAVLTAIPIHLLIALDLSRWFIKAIDKWCRKFLWCGHKELRGGKLSRVMAPGNPPSSTWWPGCVRPRVHGVGTAYAMDVATEDPTS